MTLPTNPVVDAVALKPCPFCAGRAYSYFRNMGWAQCVEENDCSVHPAVCADTEAEAITAWNDRPTDAALVEAQWQDIETAPKDGTEILVFREDAGVFTAHYVEDDAHLSNCLNPPEGDCYWFSTDGEDLTNDMPTHWQPLPTPPALTRGERT